MVIAALYVAKGGPYVGLDGVEPWTIDRDARTYSGPHRVVAHPPCARWGRYWGGGPSASVRRELGDDGGCFESALASVREFGGVLEHPEASHAWGAFGIAKPPRSGGWVSAGDCGGWTCCVEQGHYGHRARKATWLYAFGVDLPELRWGASTGKARIDQGYHSAEERRQAPNRERFERLSKAERIHTPVLFRDVLLSLARSVEPPSNERNNGKCTNCKAQRPAVTVCTDADGWRWDACEVCAREHSEGWVVNEHFDYVRDGGSVPPLMRELVR